MSKGIWAASVKKVLGWSNAHSFWYLSVRGSCCGDEVLSTAGCRYDFERFGCVEVNDPRKADLLIVSGQISHAGAPKLKEIYDLMVPPKFVMAVGACACSGGLFSGKENYSTLEGVDKVIPVDVYVPGCPPRPEAIMHGVMALQEKICGSRRIEESRI